MGSEDVLRSASALASYNVLLQVMLSIHHSIKWSKSSLTLAHVRETVINRISVCVDLFCVKGDVSLPDVLPQRLYTEICVKGVDWRREC